MAVTGHKLRINGGSSVNEIVDVGLVFSYVFTELAPSTEYAIEVASYDEFGNQSPWSDPQVATTDPAPEMTAVVDDDGNALVDDDGEMITVFS